MFCVDPKYHAEDLAHLEGRKESSFLSFWRLVAPWPTFCCSCINIHKPGKVTITDLVLAKKKNYSSLEFETLAEYLRELTRGVEKVVLNSK